MTELTEFERSAERDALEKVKASLIKLGYTITVDEDGTERVLRPDGTTVMVAKKNKEEKK